jgi:hypothetical protein
VVPPSRRKKKAPAMYGTLPFGANLEAIQKEARKLLRALRRNDVAATRRYRPFDFLDGTSHARLADAQYIIARRYGFKSWAKLRDHLLVPRAKTAPDKKSAFHQNRSK